MNHKTKRPDIYCLTPVKNEEWIIERFLKSATIWADKIIISDQGSTDNTIKIASQFEKVTIIDNSKLKEFNEQEMRAPLFAEARKYPGKKILLSLDADEIFTPNFDSPEWETMFSAEKGTRFVFNWYHVQPDYLTIRTTVENPCGFVDDGSVYDVGLIHVPRQPLKEGVPYIKFNDISILHFQFANWERMERKHIWYRMYERIHFPKKSAISIFRSLHYDKSKLTVFDSLELPFKNEWIQGYRKLNIDITSVNRLPNYIWDETIIKYMAAYSIDFFKHIDIGNIDWGKIAYKYGEKDLDKFILHENIVDKILMKYLKLTQKERLKFRVKLVDKILSLFF